MVVIGIDPGKQTGIAKYEDGKLVNLWTAPPAFDLDFLYSFGGDEIRLLVFEDSRMQSNVFTGNKLTVPARLKIARDLGRVDFQCELIQEWAENADIPIIGISPKTKGAKITDSEVFNKMTGWNGASNQHTRDGALIAWRFRNGASGLTKREMVQ